MLWPDVFGLCLSVLGGSPQACLHDIIEIARQTYFGFGNIIIIFSSSFLTLLLFTKLGILKQG
jgi:hypothetical protein